MKPINILAFLFTALFFAGCASTDSKSSNSDSNGNNQAETEGSRGTGLLMDRYISGEIPGYRE